MTIGPSPRARFRRPIKALALTLTVTAMASGCGSSRPSLGPTPTTRLAPVAAGGQSGPVVTVPTEGGVRPIAAAVDTGDQILIAPGQVEPRLLITDVHETITWTNLTTAVQQVEFFAPMRLDSGPIAPGGKWSYLARTGANIHYQTASGLMGAIDFNPS
jgi:hypothetical protein